ncbi:MAG: SDR family NAD(P)-dependent oxidoreductase [Bacteroides sp.]|nr:SDR family NAD(P)-dependent oxidoreductase [Bacteroides sp.]MCM1379345.1 SDR family NAD(P)-dependent oxidoreductase [Bacteroides sp.]MCM1445205.1 SDR family NAD(P)-dependent oxidoreductase [Prevotella sp.]
MKILIMGASSGLGAKLASLYLAAGHKVACAARRKPSGQWTVGSGQWASIDVTSADAPEQLLAQIERLGGMDLYIHVAGIGYDDPALDPDREAAIAQTNCVGFARMVSSAYNWFVANNPHGQIAAISSIAGTRGTTPMEAYSASKRFDWTYLEGLRQRAATSRTPISITDIRPGWTRTPLLKPGKKYPLLMDPDYASRLIVRAISRRKKVAYIDWRWHLLYLGWRIIPAAIWHHINAEKLGFA